VTKEDAQKLPRKFRLKLWHPSVFDIVMAGHMKYPFAALKTRELGEFTVCVALEGEVGKKVKCAIYKSRPDVCATVMKPGDKTCRMLRRQYKEDLR